MKGVLRGILAACLLIVPGVGAWWAWREFGDAVYERVLNGEPVAEPDAETYATLVEEVERWRKDLAQAHASARTEEEKARIEQDARVILELVLPEMMRCWLGTPYDFNGTADRPGSDTVACGYFVSTVIRDAGFRVDRYKLAQQPSGNILRTFLKAESCHLRVGQDFESYSEWVAGLEHGVYLVGLDSHVGFLVHSAEGLRFLHSSRWQDRGVVDEPGRKAGALKHSNWRMIGCLTADADVIRTWLGGGRVKVKG